jgi:hypothetical protein
MKQTTLAILLAFGIGIVFIAHSGISASAGDQGCYRADSPTGSP